MIKTILIIILSLGLVAIVVFLDVPGVQGILDKRKEIEIQKQKLIEKQELLAKVQKLTRLYEENKESVEMTEYIVSSSEDFPNLIVELESLVFEQGLILEKIDISTVQKERAARQQAETQEQEKPQDYNTLAVTIRLTGTYEAFKNFLQALEENIRLMDIGSVGFKSAQSEEETETGPRIFEFNVTLSVYFQ